MKYNNIYYYANIYNNICIIIALCDIVFSPRFIIDTIKKKKKRNEKEKNFNSKIRHSIRIINAPSTTSSYEPPHSPPRRHYFLISH